MKFVQSAVVIALVVLTNNAGALRTTSGSISRVSPTINTPQGPMFGVPDRSGWAFKGIPYAAPPVGNLRFADPQEPANWTQPLNATVFSPGCMSICPPLGFPKPKIACTPTVSEDCLYLNVYTPTLKADANLPVMIFIHGGNFMYGSGGVPIFDGSSFAVNQSVVVVTINYRLGLFGGLFTGTVKGQFQIKDQRMAMKWVQNNIAAFGGNPDHVVLSGQSAGATSMAIHMASPKSWPYFHGIIIESYPASLIPGTPELTIKLGEKVLKQLNCPQGGDPELACLRAANADVLLNISDKTQYTPWPNQIIAELMRWQPFVDGDELPYQPITAMRNGNVSNVPVFIGTNANETAGFIHELFPKAITQDKWNEALLFMLGFETGAKAIKEYGNAPAIQKDDVRPFATNIATDYIFYCPARYYAEAATQHAPSYVYFFDKAPYWNSWFYSSQPYCQENVCHASDIVFWSFPWGSESVEAVGLDVPLPHPDDFALSNFVQTAWGNFVNSFNPNTPRPLPNANGHSYQVFDGKTDILVNSSTPVGQIQGYRENFCKFWDQQGYIRN